MKHWDDSGRCEDCRQKRDRVIARLNLPGRPKCCDECFEEYMAERDKPAKKKGRRR